MEIEPLPRFDPVDASLASFSGNVFDCEAVAVCRSSQQPMPQEVKVGTVYEISSSDEEAETKAAAVSMTSDALHPVSKNAGEVSSERRFSRRLQSQAEKERADYGKRNAHESCAVKDIKKRCTVERKQESVLPKHNECDNNENSLEKGDGNKGEENEMLSCDGLGDVDEKLAYARVKRTLRIFNSHYLHFIQGDKKASKKVEASNSKGESSYAEDSKRSSKRPDLKAISRMIEMKDILYQKGRLGHLPGIHVGFQFFSRAEMVVVGLHSHWLNGIDYLGQQFSKLEKFKSYAFPLAVSIVMSGQYEDDLDNSENIVYTGQGGNDLLGTKHQVCDQQMARGNLALKNSMEHGVPIRVTRGHVSGNSYCGKVYTYDGLYKVVKYWAEKGVSGFTVYKYLLKRLEGQPDLTTDQVHFTRKHASGSLSILRGLVCEDISGGREDIPIPATNEVDDPPVAPTGFVYHKSIQVPEGINLPLDAVGCKCKGSCLDPKVCSCARLNGSDFPYVQKDGGRLVEAKAVVFECGPNCGCGADCVNRTSQRGLRYRLEVFRTPKKGWAVRSWDSIPAGALICEYIGIVRRTDELDSVFDNNFIFDIDCLQTMEGLDGRERRLGDVSLYTKAHLARSDDNKSENVPEFCIDAGTVGNVARFINHSCEPNLFIQCVLSSHHDIRLARVMLFAADNIPPLQELTYDYGYTLNSVVGPDGNIKTLACYCGAADCRKRLY